MKPLRQIGVFSMVGIAATLTHIAVGLALHRGAGVAPFTANLAAFFVATTVTIWGNGRYTFRVGLSAPRVARALAGLVATLGLNQAIVHIATDVLALPYEAALAAIIAIVPATSFLVLKYWAFRA